MKRLTILAAIALVGCNELDQCEILATPAEMAACSQRVAANESAIVEPEKAIVETEIVDCAAVGVPSKAAECSMESVRR